MHTHDDVWNLSWFAQLDPEMYHVIDRIRDLGCRM